jgi:hypothetical protein
MNHCRYCLREIGQGAGTCADCADYEGAARVAARVVEDSGIRSDGVAASVAAEIVREYLLRSAMGARARRPAPPPREPVGPGRLS